MHVGRLADNMEDGFGNVISYQQRTEFLLKAIHQFVTVAGCCLKPTQYGPRLSGRDFLRSAERTILGGFHP
jgi:hypothetical protein